MSQAAVDAILSYLGRGALAGGLTILAVALLRLAAPTLLAPRWWALLWLVGLARLVVPALPAFTWSPISAAQQGVLASPLTAKLRTLTTPAPALQTIAPSAASAAEDPSSETLSAPPIPAPRSRWSRLSWDTIALGVWAAGALAMLGLIALSQRRAVFLFAQGRQLTEDLPVDLAQNLRGRLGLKQPVLIVESPAARSPVVFGFLRPVIILPTSLRRELSEDELSAVLLHELAHVRRRDILVAWIAAFVLAIQWFNPLAYLAVRGLGRERELACDELALQATSPTQRVGYGHALLRILELCRPARAFAPAPGLAAITENGGSMNARITMIAKFRDRSWRQTAAGAAAVLLLTGAVMTEVRAEPADAKAAPVSAAERQKALDLLKAVSKKYATCSSYQDTGVVRGTMTSPSAGVSTDIHPFSTSFARPDRLRYEFRDGESSGAHRYVVWGNGDGYRSWWTVRPQVTEFREASSALAGAIGVSNGSASAVLPMLHGGNATATFVQNPSIAGHEEINGRRCVRINAQRFMQPGEFSVWIDEENLLVRRITEKYTLSVESIRESRRQAAEAMAKMGRPATDMPAEESIESLDIESQIDIEPAMNIEIDPAVFDVQIPQAEAGAPSSLP